MKPKVSDANKCKEAIYLGLSAENYMCAFNKAIRSAHLKAAEYYLSQAIEQLELARKVLRG